MKISLNIKTRLTLWYLLVTAALIVLFSVAAYFLLSQGLGGRTIRPWDMGIAQIEKTTDGKSRITGISDIGQQDWGNPASGVVMISHYSKNELLENVSEEGDILVHNILIDKDMLEGLDLYEGDSIWFYTSLDGDEASVVVVTQSGSEVAAILEAFRQVLFIIIPLALVLAGLFGYFLVKRALRPVQVITRAAREIEEENLDKRLDTGSNDELGQLASTLNHMLARLEDAFNRERQFTADASHELRTPLAVIQGEATLALKKERNVDEYRKSLENIYQETERMSSVLKRLLFLARNEDNKQPEFEVINLKELLTELVSDIEVLCEEKSIRCQLHAPDDLFIKGDKVSLRELFFNLIDNAVRYTHSGGEVSLILGGKDNSACVAVKDNGIGIPEDHLKHIFKRFYRVDKSRSRSEGGAGLGLAICERIAEFHNGTIKVESTVGGGSTFLVFLPLFNKR